MHDLVSTSFASVSMQKRRIEIFSFALPILLTLLPSTSASCFSTPSLPSCADASTFYSDVQVQNDLLTICNTNPQISGCRWRFFAQRILLIVTGLSQRSTPMPATKFWHVQLPLCTMEPSGRYLLHQIRRNHEFDARLPVLRRTVQRRKHRRAAVLDRGSTESRLDRYRH